MHLKITNYPSHWEWDVSFNLVDHGYEQEFRNHGKMPKGTYYRAEVLKEARRQLNVLLKQAYRQVANGGVIIEMIHSQPVELKRHQISPNWRIE